MDRLLKDYFSTGDLTKPYFEVLIVSDDPTAEQVRQGRTELRQLRRPEDPFIYEAVTVPSFEEAVAAVVMNADVQSVIIKDNFRFKSQFDAPLLRSYLEQHDDASRQQKGEDSSEKDRIHSVGLSAMA